MFTISIAEKSDKKAIKRFYKSQNYSASYMGVDHCYLIKCTSKVDNILASVIVSQIKPQNPQYLLHALVVAKTHSGQGLATALLHHVIDKVNTNFNKDLVCFAAKILSPLYLKNGFILSNKNELSEELALRYSTYQNKHPDLKVFIASLNNGRNK